MGGGSLNPDQNEGTPLIEAKQIEERGPDDNLMNMH